MAVNVPAGLLKLTRWVHQLMYSHYYICFLFVCLFFAFFKALKWSLRGDGADPSEVIYFILLRQRFEFRQLVSEIGFSSSFVNVMRITNLILYRKYCEK